MSKGITLSFQRKHLLLLGFVILLAAIGILGLAAWYGLLLPNVLNAGNSTALAVLFGSVAGFGAFFAPCAFPMFPSYISYYLSRSGSNRGWRQPLRVGLFAAFGILLFFVALSVPLALFGLAIFGQLTLLQRAVGVTIVVLGIAMFRGFTLPYGRFTRLFMRPQASNGPVSGGRFFLFGAGYGAASLGCTAPVFFALVVLPMTTGLWSVAVAAFASYAIVKASTMVVLTVVAASSGQRLFPRLQASTERIKKASGLVLIVAGAYIVISPSLMGILY